MTALSSPPPIGPYSPALRAGEWLFCSGQLGLDGDALADGGVAAELRVAVARLKVLLAEHGLGLGDVVKTTVYLADMGAFAEMNEAYVDAFAGARPARSAVGVAALPMGALVEIDAIAHLDAARR